jgi:hypothetical protein
MVRAVLAQVDARVPVKCVHATRGKWLRAEPVAAMYGQGKVKHAGSPLAALADEMCDFGVGGLSSGASPDRLDALVWAVTELTGRWWQGPRIRSTWEGPLVPPRIWGGGNRAGAGGAQARDRHRHAPACKIRSYVFACATICSFCPSAVTTRSFGTSMSAGRIKA